MAIRVTVGVFVVSGGDDFLLHVAVPNTDALYAFVIDRLTERPEVVDVNTSVARGAELRFLSGASSFQLPETSGWMTKLRRCS